MFCWKQWEGNKFYFPFSSSFLGFQNGLLVTWTCKGVLINLRTSLFEIININLRSPVMAMLYLWFCNGLVFYPVGISPLYLGVSVEVAKKKKKNPRSLKERRLLQPLCLSFFNLDEVIYLWKLYSIQYMGLMSAFIVLKCHIYLDQMKNDYVENKIIFL